MKLWHSFKKELKLASQSFYFYIEFITAIIILAVLLFAVPENFAADHTEYIAFDVPAAYEEHIRGILLEDDLDGKPEMVEIKSNRQLYKAELIEEEDKKVYILETEAEVKQLAEDKRKLGVVITTNDQGIFYRYYVQGYESDRFKNTLQIIHIKDAEVLKGEMDQQDVRPLLTGFTPLNDRENAIPPLLVLNGSLMGFFVIAAYIFLDKQEGVIKAYAVTAAAVWQYLLSKVGVLLLTTIISSLIIVIPIMGLQLNYPLLILFLLTTGFFGSSLGLLLASFYQNIMQSFGALFTLMMCLGIPSISYYIASWEPVWVRYIPTYAMIQGFKEIIVDNQSISYVLMASLGFFVTGLVLFIIANQRYKKNLTV